jgi:ATP-binding cassette subfamily C exporter for protease/lipase
VLVTHRSSVLVVVDKMLLLKDGKQHLYGTRDQVLKTLAASASASAAVTVPSASENGG